MVGEIEKLEENLKFVADALKTKSGDYEEIAAKVDEAIGALDALIKELENDALIRSCH